MNILKEVNSLEQRLGVPRGFYLSLMNEDDWSFVIKLHALFEASSTYILTKKLGKPNIESTISRLPMSDTQASKLTLISELDILNTDQQKFTRFLSELRNKLIHKIENVQFSFETHIGVLDSNQKKSFAKNAGMGVVDKPKFDGKVIDKNQFVLDNPRLCIWMSASEILACLRLEEDFIEIDKRKAVLEAQERFQHSKFEELYALLKDARNGA